MGHKELCAALPLDPNTEPYKDAFHHEEYGWSTLRATRWQQDEYRDKKRTGLYTRMIILPPRTKFRALPINGIATGSFEIDALTHIPEWPYRESVEKPTLDGKMVATGARINALYFMGIPSRTGKDILVTESTEHAVGPYHATCFVSVRPVQISNCPMTWRYDESDRQELKLKHDTDWKILIEGEGNGFTKTSEMRQRKLTYEENEQLEQDQWARYSLMRSSIIRIYAGSSLTGFCSFSVNGKWASLSDNIPVTDMLKVGRMAYLGVSKDNTIPKGGIIDSKMRGIRTGYLSPDLYTPVPQNRIAEWEKMIERIRVRLMSGWKSKDDGPFHNL